MHDRGARWHAGERPAHIVASLQSDNRRICMDGRMLREKTGVASYARMLHAALPLIVDRTFVLDDTAAIDAAPAGRERRRWARLAAALPLRARHATQAGPREAPLLVYPDLFRSAQIHFDIYRRLLPIDVPGPPGIMHWTYPVPIRIEGWINLYTVHDAIPLVHPELTPIDARRHRRLLERIAEHAAALVTVSGSARADILGALRCRADFVVDCAQAVDVSPKPTRTMLPQGLEPGRYLLVCGTVEPRKNIARIVQAYRESGAALPLVIAGPDGWRAAELAQALASPGVVRLPYLARGAMLATIAHARALLMPSLAEGFGLPVAEAMALGTPVLASSSGALAETAGGAAVLVDPLDVRDIARGIRHLVEDDRLGADRAAAGRVRAAQFTLPRFAGALAALYGKFIASPSR